MVFDPEDRAALPFLATLEAATAPIRQEALALPPSAWLPLPDAQAHTRGRWEVCLLKLDRYSEDFPLARLEDNRALCPRTWEVLSALPGLLVAGIMRLSPGSVVLPHRDRREDDVLRVHLGLQLPPEDRAHWPEGRTRLMDIRQLHEARNLSDRDRLTLCCDVRLDRVIPDGVIPPWNPGLEERLRAEAAARADGPPAG